MKRVFQTNSRLINEHFANYKSTFYALCELINNSIQAGAKNVFINLTETTEENPLVPTYSKIQIKDDGSGVAQSDVDQKLMFIGTQVKNGGKGIGRFSAFQIGGCIEIESVAYDSQKAQQTYIRLPLHVKDFSSSQNLGSFSIQTNENVMETPTQTYYKVTISEIYEAETKQKNSRKRICKELLLENIEQALFEHYPIDLFNKKFNLFINDKLLDINKFVQEDPINKDYIYTDNLGDTSKIKGTFFKISLPENYIKVFLRVKNEKIWNVATSLNYTYDTANPNLGCWFIYFDIENTSVDLERNLVISNMDESIKHLLNYLKGSLDSFFVEVNQHYDNFIKELEGDFYYPYKSHASSSESKIVAFNQIVYLLDEKYKIKSKYGKLREIIYPLIDKAISNGDLQYLIKDIVKADNQTLEKYKSISDKTDIDSIIEFSESVAQKNQFLDFLYQLVYGDISDLIKERSQLHKIIEKNLWVFGEEYNNTPHLFSDKNLQNILEKLREENFKYEPSSAKDNDSNKIKVSDIKIKNITDLFFFAEKPIDGDRREIIIVELKAPKVKISYKELQQADKYAFQIEQQGVFSNNLVYKIYLVSSDISEFAKSKIGQISTNQFLYSKLKTNKNIEIYVLKWSDLIELNRRRLSYLGKALKTKDIDVAEKFKNDFGFINTENINSRLSSTPNPSIINVSNAKVKNKRVKK